MLHIYPLYIFTYFLSTFAFREQIPQTYCANMKISAKADKGLRFQYKFYQYSMQLEIKVIEIQYSKYKHDSF